VDPSDLDSDWNLSRSVAGNDPVERIGSAIASQDSLAELLADRIRYLPPYDAMKSWLGRYRESARAGGWPRVPAGPVLKPGMSDTRVPALRRRLEATGELDRGATDSELFDDTVERAVIEFQQRHRLDNDGVVGQQTLDALNVSVEERIGQIRVNLERVRWIYRDVEDSFVIVNIAGFEVFLIRDGEIVWRSPAQVGKTYRKTPVFKATMKYLVFNPTWTVPPTILAKDVLPKVQRDPGYLRRKNMNVIDGDGRVIDPSTIDWSAVTPRNFGYAFRQEPGPDNALGRVKFIFPNSHFVFLHDTPSKALFDRADRAFSSGCIRVKNPFELAELLLAKPSDWNQERISEVIGSGKTQTVFLPEPMTVMLLYWTVVIDAESGAIQFLKDVYGRDRAVLSALDEEFVFRPPDDLPDWAPSH
jgi:murein L,D-transpeptidase YcbB/YkuD